MIKIFSAAGLLFVLGVSSCQRAPLASYRNQPVETFAHRQKPASVTHSPYRSADDQSVVQNLSTEAEPSEPVLLADSREGVAGVATAMTARPAKVESYAIREVYLTKPAKPTLKEKVVARLVERKLARMNKYSDDQSVKKPQAQLTSLQIAGLVLAGLGLIFLLIVNFIIGLVFLIGGLLMLLLGSGSVGGGSGSRPARAPSERSAPARSKTTRSSNRGPVEVVYLKNGSIIRGSIIEQIPNQTITIRTADGSQFVYKMSEVTKITKEE